MAQVIVTLCDLCDDQRTAGDPVVVALGVKAPPRVLDLCARHHAELVGPLADALGEYGRKVAAEPPAPNGVQGKLRYERTPDGADHKYPCIFCGFGSTSSTALSQHMRNQHEVTSTTAAYGSPPTCYLCGEQFEEGGLGGHSRSHGVEGAHGIYRAALEAGDPLDLIAKRRAELGIAVQG